MHKHNAKDTTHFSSGTIIWKFINKQNVWFPSWNWEAINVSQRARYFITHGTNSRTNAWCNIPSLVWIFYRRWEAVSASYCRYTTKTRIRTSSSTRNIIKAICARLQWVYLHVKPHETYLCYTYYRYNNSGPSSQLLTSFCRGFEEAPSTLAEPKLG